MQGLESLNFWNFQGPKHLGLASKGTGLHGALDLSPNHSSQTPSTSLSPKLLNAAEFAFGVKQWGRWSLCRLLCTSESPVGAGAMVADIYAFSRPWRRRRLSSCLKKTCGLKHEAIHPHLDPTIQQLELQSEKPNSS